MRIGECFYCSHYGTYADLDDWVGEWSVISEYFGEPPIQLTIEIEVNSDGSVVELDRYIE